MKITVTKDDIDKGIPQEADRCPIALAVRRCFKLGDTDRVMIDDSDIEIGDDKYITPLAAEEFITKFDSHDDVEPFEFELGEAVVVEVSDGY